MPSTNLLSRYGAAALFVGALVSLQSRMNGALAVAIGDPFLAAFWNFSTGLIGACLLVAIFPAARAGIRSIGAAIRAGRLRNWHLLGGVSGAVFIAVQSFATPQLGVAVFLVAVVAGQSISALAVDRLGIGPAGVQHVTSGRVIAAAVATGGVAIAVADRFQIEAANIVVPVALAFAVGAITMVQVAVNGRVNVATGQPLAATWVNFVVGTLTTALMCLLVGSQLPSLDSVQWWMLFGGMCGLMYVAMLSIIVKHLGVLWSLLGSLLGQLGGAVVLDLANPATRDLVTPYVFVGLLVTLVATALASFVAARR